MVCCLLARCPRFLIGLHDVDTLISALYLISVALPSTSTHSFGINLSQPEALNSPKGGGTDEALHDITQQWHDPSSPPQSFPDAVLLKRNEKWCH